MSETTRRGSGDTAAAGSVTVAHAPDLEPGQAIVRGAEPRPVTLTVNDHSARTFATRLSCLSAENSKATHVGPIVAHEIEQSETYLFGSLWRVYRRRPIRRVHVPMTEMHFHHGRQASPPQ
jgi:hypothetical protein